MLSFDRIRFRYEPYPIGLARPVLDEDRYRALVQGFPPTDLFRHLPKFGNKYSLSEKNHPDRYRAYIDATPIYRDLHRWIKSPDFIDSVDGMLKAHWIDLGLGEYRRGTEERWRMLWRETRAGRFPRISPGLRTRFEFSMLPADGGAVLPHTDTPRKMITLIVSIVGEGEWDQAYGGGTDVNRPKNDRHAFNWINAQVPFEEVDVLDTFEFQPNQCVVFVKTFNSLHSVRKMAVAGSTAMRRTLTINIETDE